MIKNNEIPISSGVDGLDKILDGGFKIPSISPKNSSPNGLVLLIRGKAGSGKTTLALQIVSESLQWQNNEDVHNMQPRFYTIDQSKEDIERKLKSLSKEDINQIDIIDSNHNENEENEDDEREKPFSADVAYSIEAVFKIRSNLTRRKAMCDEKNEKRGDDEKKWCHNVIAIDGLNCLEKIDRDESLEFAALILLLRQVSKISIIVYEPTENDTSSVEYLVDMTIDLKDEADDNSANYFSRRLRISKSRYQKVFSGWNEYAIKDNGFKVYPSIYTYIHKVDHMKNKYQSSLKPFSKQSDEPPRDTGGIIGRELIRDEEGNVDEKEYCDESIIARILGKINRGSSTVLFGARRTSKSQLTMDFLRAGARVDKKKKGLLLSLIDNQHTIMQEASCLRTSCDEYVNMGKKCCRKCFENIFLFHLRPARITPEEFFYYLKKRLDRGKDQEQNIRRLVFWDLTQLEYRFPLLSEDPMFLPTLMDFLKQYVDSKDDSGKEKIGISSLFMAAANTKLSSAASAMADNVIFCWRDKVKNILDTKSNEMDCYEKYLNKFKATKNDNIKNFLVIYVDRAEGVIRTTKRELFCFPLTYEGSPIVDFKKPILPYRVENTGWLERANSELERIDRLQGVPA